VRWLSRGLVFARGMKSAARGQGHTLYKAENILAGETFGDPQAKDVDIASARNLYCSNT